jgi:hypothetical protein
MTQNLSLPGLSAAAADRLVTLLEPRVTSLTGDRLLGLPMTIYGAADPELERLGVHLSGNADVTVIVADPDTKLHANIRLLGSDSAVVFDRLDDGYISLHDVFMRSNRQVLLWGAGATAVGCNIEIEGDDRCVAIGEDALISSGIWIRNHDMHAVHDLRSGDRINRPPVDTILERHVWLGQNALLLNCQRIGTGSIVGAMSLVKGVVGECVAVAGAPARVIRYQVSWGRQASGMTEQERSSLGWKPV